MCHNRSLKWFAICLVSVLAIMACILPADANIRHKKPVKPTHAIPAYARPCQKADLHGYWSMVQTEATVYDKNRAMTMEQLMAEIDKRMTEGSIPSTPQTMQVKQALQNVLNMMHGGIEIIVAFHPNGGSKGLILNKPVTAELYNKFQLMPFREPYQINAQGQMTMVSGEQPQAAVTARCMILKQDLPAKSQDTGDMLLEMNQKHTTWNSQVVNVRLVEHFKKIQ